MRALLFCCVLSLMVGCGAKQADPAASTSSSSGAAAGGYEIRDATPEPLSQWKKLGERSLDAEGNHDGISVAADEGKVSSIRFVLEHGKLEIASVILTYDDKSTLSIPAKMTFGQGTTSRAIDLPGEPRVVRKIDFTYTNPQKGRGAQVQLWAR